MSTNKIRIAAFAGLVLAVVPIYACSKKQEDTAPTTPPATQPASAPSTAPGASPAVFPAGVPHGPAVPPPGPRK